jgi:hypothetical protein
MNFQDILDREYYQKHIFYFPDKHDIIITTSALSRICGVSVDELVRFSATIPNPEPWPLGTSPVDDESIWHASHATAALFKYNLLLLVKLADWGVIGYCCGLIGISFKWGSLNENESIRTRTLEIIIEPA